MKTLHVVLVVSSGSLFFIRGCLHWLSSPLLQQALLRRLPHVNDSLLLVTGFSLVYSSNIWSLSSPWLLTKLCLLLLYILLGMAAFKWLTQRRLRMVAWMLALMVYGFMISVALSKQPLGVFVI